MKFLFLFLLLRRKQGRRGCDSSGVKWSAQPCAALLFRHDAFLAPDMLSTRRTAPEGSGFPQPALPGRPRYVHASP